MDVAIERSADELVPPGRTVVSRDWDWLFGQVTLRIELDNGTFIQGTGGGKLDAILDAKLYHRG